MTRRRRSHSSGGMWVSRGMAWPAVGVVGAVRPARIDIQWLRLLEGWSRRRRIWRLEQEDQRLKKHDGRWIDIQRLRLLESFVVVYNK